MVQQIHKLLNRALADATQLNVTWHNVSQMVTVPRLPRREKSRALTLEQARQLLGAAYDDPLEALSILALTTGL